MSCSNAVPPLQLPITNNSVTPDGRAITRGIHLGVGTPQQFFSLLPSIGSEDLFLFSLADCGSLSNDSCIGPKGGVFDPDASSTYMRTTPQQWNGTSSTTLRDEGFIFFNDVLRYGSTGIAWGLPMFLDQYGVGSQAELPLGPRSTFLKTVHEGRQAPSTAYGLWIGSKIVAAPANGLLVVGGYDNARVDGDWTALPYNASCLGCVTVTGLIYETSTGSQSLLGNSSQKVSAVLDPFLPGTYLPQPIFDKFGSLSGAYFKPSWEDWVYNISSPPTGNISVTLSTGFKTIIRTVDLFTQPRSYHTDGIYTVDDQSAIVSTIYNTSVTSEIVLGANYLVNYVIYVDHAREEFKLAPARRDQTLTPDITPICPVAVKTTSSATAATSSSALTPAKNSHSNHAGAVAGGVVGGVLGLALILLAIWCSARRRRRTQQAPVEIDGYHVKKEHELGGNRLSEMSYNPAKPHELESETTTATSPTQHELGVGTGDGVSNDLRDQEARQGASDRFEMP